MPIDLYQVPGSAPCRAVRLVAAALGVELNLKLTDLMAKEHLKPEFLKASIYIYLYKFSYIYSYKLNTSKKFHNRRDLVHG